MKKIMFNDRYGLTQAVLDGRKTMTRRIATELNHPNITDISEWGIDSKGNAMLLITYDTGLQEEVYPRFQIGDEVAVAQSYSNAYDVLRNKRGKKVADDWGCKVFNTLGSIPPLDKRPAWTNKMFVRADIMPHRIRTTDIKMERLQDISEEDCMREGIRESIVEFGGKKIVQWTYFHEKRTIWFDSPREAFAALIDRISGKGTWERNPWVFAYEFELDGE